MALMVIPDFELTGFYYPEVYEDLINYKRRYLRELTAEDDEEPLIQLFKAISWIAHLRSCAIDANGREALFKTLQLRSSLQSYLEWAGETLADASPSVAEVIGRVTTRVDRVPVTLVEDGSLFFTSSEDPDVANVVFERSGSVQLTQRNDQIGYVFEMRDDVLTDFSTAAKNSTSWIPGTPLVGQKLYFGHTDVMFRQLNLMLDAASPALPGIVHGVWEVYEGFTRFKAPDVVESSDDDVAIAEGKLRFRINGALGTKNRGGTKAIVMCALTGAYEEVESAYRSGAPDHDTVFVDDGNGTIAFRLDGVLGTTDQSGMTVDVKFISSGVTLPCSITYLDGHNYALASGTGWDFGQTSPSWTAEDYWVDAGPNEVLVSSFLGQSTISKSPAHYCIYLPWQEVENLEDETSCFLDGQGLTSKISWDLPQTALRSWIRGDEDTGVTAYWVRFRVIAVAPSVAALRFLHATHAEGEHWVSFLVEQGETFVDSLDVGTGQPDQSFVPSKFPVLLSTMRVYVTEEDGRERLYSRVQHPFDSGPTDRIFVADQDELGQVVGYYGDGTNGKAPPLGAECRLIAKQMDDLDGNVPADTIISGSVTSYLDKITNPRGATGWVQREGTDEFSIYKAKLLYPRKLRSLDNRALNGPDVEVAAVKIQDASGRRYVSRATSMEIGQKLIQVVLVGPGGNPLSAPVLAAIETYFNGSKALKIRGRIVANTRVRATNYYPQPINLRIVAPGGGKTFIENLISLYLQPEARDPNDDTTHLWDFGEVIDESKIKGLILQADQTLNSVRLEGTGTGTISGTSGTHVVTGVSTKFLEELNPGDEVSYRTFHLTVSEITSDTEFVAIEEIETTFSTQAFTYEMKQVALGPLALPTKGKIQVVVA